MTVYACDAIEPMPIKRGQPATVTIYLDESIVRMCLKHHIHPRHLMLQALLDELHTKAVELEQLYMSQPAIPQAD